MLINASIGRNISLAKPEASLEEIREAARTAQIDDFIMSLPKGYDSVLGTGLLALRRREPAREYSACPFSRHADPHHG